MYKFVRSFRIPNINNTQTNNNSNDDKNQLNSKRSAAKLSSFEVENEAKKKEKYSSQNKEQVINKCITKNDIDIDIAKIG
jgi:hypothetical protein